jgi:hypothetical protein
MAGADLTTLGAILAAVIIVEDISI